MKKMSVAKKREMVWAWAFILPTILGLVILNFYPVINTVYQSFCKTGDFGRGNVFVGLDNYKAVVTSSETWQSLWNTIKYAIIEVQLGVIIAMLLAVLMQNKIKGKTFFRTIFFIQMLRGFQILRLHGLALE